MSQLELLHSLDDPRLDPFARLTDVQLRSRIEPEKGLLIAETLEVIGRALDAGLTPTALLTAPEYECQARSAIERIRRTAPDAALLGLPLDQLKGLTGFPLTRGALCAFRRPAPRDPRTLLRTSRVVAVLEDIRNHTNVGAIFRSAAALGADAVLVSPACYDPFYRRAVRVSMGAVFQVPWARIGDDPHHWAQTGVPLLHEEGFTVAALALEPHSIELSQLTNRVGPKVALVLGTEGTGLAASTIEAADLSVRIPMQRGVDSLNVAAASAVAFWELARAAHA
ncbi:RNA methyltransferase [Eggerthellaceae bacterium zg-1084]|uniref:TrmH family RNA methyltransferase n=1 Tax=Berryella wangjianweii TaxID=2734634 RepID=UPI001552601A|nr:RNA methyltransferase [Berryella wangjianweii]NPD31557.1 RNA methyltransferase [Berryella wangjianweii]NPD32948.1 RNA methyltransferase [Eggerthellaceae bacterium zg-997]